MTIIETIIKFPNLIKNNYDKYRNEIIKDDFLFVEEIILRNEIEVLDIILEKENISILFLPGFYRNENNLKRMIPFYLFFLISDETKNVILKNNLYLKLFLKYKNENIILNY